MIAWYPEEIVAPPELTAVLVEKGQLSELEWIEALSERVNELVLKEEDPLEEAKKACRKMGLPPVQDESQLGAALVQQNLDLLTFLSVAQQENPFPANVSQASPVANEALKSVNLEQWVELALSQVSVSSLD
jgi:hypothetical protein